MNCTQALILETRLIIIKVISLHKKTEPMIPDLHHRDTDEINVFANILLSIIAEGSPVSLVCMEIIRDC